MKEVALSDNVTKISSINTKATSNEQIDLFETYGFQDINTRSPRGLSASDLRKKSIQMAHLEPSMINEDEFLSFMD